MKNRSPLLRWLTFCSLTFVACVSFAISMPMVTKANSQPTKRVDVIALEAGAVDGKLSMPPAIFRHDVHTTVMAKAGKTCTDSCHVAQDMGGEQVISFSFMELGSLKGDEAKDAFHAKCISCHTQQAKAGNTVAPLEANCRSCHVGAPEGRAPFAKMDFYDKLHELHTESPVLKRSGSDTNCATCHHTGYDKATNTFMATEDTGESCSNCHYSQRELRSKLQKDPQAQDEYGPLATRSDLKTASHKQCISCHIAVTAKGGAKSGPATCAGCHTPIPAEKKCP